MKDFQSRGITAGYICGEKDDAETKSNVSEGALQLVLFTPEAFFLNQRWRRLLCSELYQQDVSFLMRHIVLVNGR